MIPEQEKDILPNLNKLSLNTDYYNNVFKRTERLVSVLFYILGHIEDSARSRVHTDALTARGLSLYELVLGSLSWHEPGLRERLGNVQVAYVGFSGTVRIATAAGVLTEALRDVLFAEVDLVTRYIRNHFLEESAALQSATAPLRTARPAAGQTPRTSRVQTRITIPAGDISSDAHLVYSQLTDRGERIKTVLEAKPEATIKDIAEIITDVSEKTIQRELNSLIEKGQVIRQGERRWSRYSINK
jgi:DNA-binding transcriptional ArsR family regulator